MSRIPPLIGRCYGTGKFTVRATIDFLASPMVSGERHVVDAVLTSLARGDQPFHKRPKFLPEAGFTGDVVETAVSTHGRCKGFVFVLRQRQNKEHEEGGSHRLFVYDMDGTHCLLKVYLEEVAA